MLGPGTPYGDYYEAMFVEFPDDAPFRAVCCVDELGGLRLGPKQWGRRSVVANGVAFERVAVSTTHNLLCLLVTLGLDRDAALKRLVEGLRSKSTRHGFLRDESRRSAAACRAFLVFVSLLKRMKENTATGSNNGNTDMEEEEKEGVEREKGVPASLLERLKEEAASAAAAAELPEERAGVL